MADIGHRIGIAAQSADVYAQLTTPEGLAQWWTRDLAGDPKLGGKLQFFFGGPDRSVVMEVVELAEDRHVAWRCVEGPGEWIDTTISFDLKSSDDETVLLFNHAGWREPVEFMSHCTTKWAYFLLGMKAGLEGSAPTPFPDELPISSWG